MFGKVLAVLSKTTQPMKNFITSLVMLLCINMLGISQANQQAVIVISSSSTPTYIGEMKESLKEYGLVLNVEKEKWKNQSELEEFAFTITNTASKKAKSFDFKYNAINKHQIFLVYPLGDNKYGQVMTDVTYMSDVILPMVVTNEVKRQKPILHRSYGKSGGPYRQSIVMTDLNRLESDMKETVDMHKAIKADQVIGKSISGLTYTYNGEYLEHPAGINLQNMTADVLIEELEEGIKIINIWSDEPIKELMTGTTIAGQR